MTGQTLTGLRLRLRPITEADTDAVVRWRNSPSVKAGLFGQADLTPEEHLRWLHAKVMPGLCHQFIIELLESGAAVGTLLIKNIEPEHGRAELGIFIGEASARGRGYGSEAIALATGFAFKDLKLHRLQLQVLADNVQALACYRKAGFVEEGRLREAYLRDGRRQDIVIMAALKTGFTAPLEFH